MPNYFGASSELILNADIPCYSNGVAKQADLMEGREHLLGYIYGNSKTGKWRVCRTAYARQTKGGQKVIVDN